MSQITNTVFMPAGRGRGRFVPQEVLDTPLRKPVFKPAGRRRGRFVPQEVLDTPLRKPVFKPAGRRRGRFVPQEVLDTPLRKPVFKPAGRRRGRFVPQEVLDTPLRKPVFKPAGRRRGRFVPQEVLDTPLRKPVFKPAGRRRGRFVPQEVLDTPLRKPGMLLPEKNRVPDKLACLDILFTGPMEDLAVYGLLDGFLIREKCSGLDMEKMMEYIFKNMMKNPCNANYVCKYLSIMFRHVEKGHYIQKLFFHYLQKYYIDSSAIKLNQGPVEYRNLVTLFAAAAHYARNVNFAPYSLLIDALLSLALNLVPSSLQEDIQVFSLCVIRYSQYLTMTKRSGENVSNLERESRLEDAKKLSRQMYLNNDITKKSLAWLSLVVECKCITDELLEQYSPPLDKSSLDLLKSDILRIRLPKNDVTRYSLSDVSAIIDFV